MIGVGGVQNLGRWGADYSLCSYIATFLKYRSSGISE